MKKIDARGSKPEDPPKEEVEVFCPFGSGEDITLYCLRDSCGCWSQKYGKCSFTLGEDLLTIIKAGINRK